LKNRSWYIHVCMYHHTILIKWVLLRTKTFQEYENGYYLRIFRNSKSQNSNRFIFNGKMGVIVLANHPVHHTVIHQKGWYRRVYYYSSASDNYRLILAHCPVRLASDGKTTVAGRNSRTLKTSNLNPHISKR